MTLFTRRTLALIAFACALPLAAPAQQQPEKPIHGYRVTYTLTTTDAGKRVSLDHYAMTVDTAPVQFSDGRTYSGRGTIKIGQKVPVATGSSGDEKSGIQTQFTYLDIGINLDATVTESPTGLLIASKVEQSSVAPEPVAIGGVNEPLIRQMVITNSSTITPGKTLTVGSLDLPDTKRHIDIEVSVEPVS